jgi:hypothetical protein
VGIEGTLTQILVVVVLQVVGSIQKGRRLPPWSVILKSLQLVWSFPAVTKAEVLKVICTWKLDCVEPEELDISILCLYDHPSSNQAAATRLACFRVRRRRGIRRMRRIRKKIKGRRRFPSPVRRGLG